MSNGKYNLDAVSEHYRKSWNAEPRVCLWNNGPVDQLEYHFRVLEFPPFDGRDMWTYATACTSTGQQSGHAPEVHIFSDEQDTGVVELLFALAYYHRFTRTLHLNDSVNFGRSWHKQSECKYGFLSLPYLDGPAIENLLLADCNVVNCYWIIPITEQEIAYKNAYGVDALEELFENSGLDYANSKRRSLV